jgi:hypothetical protein
LFDIRLPCLSYLPLATVQSELEPLCEHQCAPFVPSLSETLSLSAVVESCVCENLSGSHFSQYQNG